MDFNVRIRRDENQSVTLELSGNLRSGEPVSQLKESIKAELRNGARNILLDMSAVTSIDSSGLGEIVSSLITVQGLDGSLKIAGLNTRSSAVIHVTGLEPILNATPQIMPKHTRTHWQSIVIVLAIVAIVTAFYWIALR